MTIKSTLIYLAFASLFLTCKSEQKEATEKVEPTNKVVSMEYVVPLDSAVLWTSNWQNNKSTISNYDSIYNAFLLHNTEMQDIFAAGATHIRTYIGLTDEMKLKLLLVGVDASNNDMINYEADQYVYDFNQPCPTNCAEKSPLYIAPISH